MTVTKITYKNGPAKCWTRALSEMYRGARDYLKLAEFALPPIPAASTPPEENTHVTTMDR